MDVDETLLYRGIGNKLRQRRTKSGVTQGQLAKEVGVLRTSITNIEAGRQKVPLHLLYKICAALEMEVVETLPTNAEVTQASTVPVELDGDVRHVPPKTAEALKRLQETQP
jgi:DNA-binding XRE family transcriptional regulator